MDKRARRINIVQNIAILFLSVSALLLFRQTAFPEQYTVSGSISSFLQHYTPAAESAPDQTPLGSPVFLIRTNALPGGAALSSDPALESAVAFLHEALQSAQTPVSVAESELLSLLNTAGLYMDFGTALPDGLLRLWLNVPSAALPGSVRRCFLIPGDTVTVYFQSEDGKSYRSTTAADGRFLADHCEANESGVFFTAAADVYGSVSPYTLISEVAPHRVSLSASAPLSESDFAALLSAAEFNPHTQDRYSESSGTVVVLEGQRSLRLQPDGTVTYSGGSAQANSLYLVSADTRADCAEAAVAAQTLLGALTRGRLGAAALYLSAATATSDGWLLLFDYAVDGTPVRFADGTHAAEITVSDGSITAFTLHCRRYVKTDAVETLLPVTLAAAVCRAYPDSELSVAYVDSYADTVSADWIAG